LTWSDPFGIVADDSAVRSPPAGPCSGDLLVGGGWAEVAGGDPPQAVATADDHHA
jgi:hypothetical protein